MCCPIWVAKCSLMYTAYSTHVSEEKWAIFNLVFITSLQHKMKYCHSCLLLWHIRFLYFKNTSKRFNPKVCIIITSLKYAKSLLIVMKNESTFLYWSKYLNIFSCPALLWHMLHTEAVAQFLSKNSILLKNFVRHF